MRWSQMTGQQRAFLTARARWQPIVVKGQVVGFEPKGFQTTRFAVKGNLGCVYARAILAAKAADRDARDARKRNSIPEMQAIVAAELGRTVQVQRCLPGKARNADYLNRPKAQALPMGQGFNGRV